MYKIIMIPSAFIFLVLFAGCFRDMNHKVEKNSMQLSEYLYSEDIEDGFKKVTQVPVLNFPRDHAAHPEYRLEWWYLTGNLYHANSENEDKARRRHFGYQFTIFRNAMHPPAIKTSNKIQSVSWFSNQMMMGHFALTDTQKKKFYAYEKFSRALKGLAYWELDPYRIYIENWFIGSGRTSSIFPLRVKASHNGTSIDLLLTPQKKMVLQGESGYSRKGPQKHNASIYYSYTRLETTGTVEAEGKRYNVTGSSWFDREISSSMLSNDQQGWDWFSLQLSDNSEMMFFRIRKKDGTPSPYTHMTLISAQGKKTQLKQSQYSLTPLSEYRAPSGSTYPSSWRLQIPETKTDLKITPRIENQELELSFVYWEGSVQIDGRHNDVLVKGDGYVELTGYD